MLRGSRITVPEFDAERILRELAPAHVRQNLLLARLFPEIQGVKQIFDGLEAQPPLAALTAITGGTSEVNLWTPNQWTPIATGPGANNYATAGQQWYMNASGICTYPVTTPGTTAFTARIGTSATPASNTILGAASAAVQGTTQSGVLWTLQGIMTIRTIGLPGANSTVYFAGEFHCPLAHQAAGSAGGVLFGGTATVDLSIANALAISITPSVTGQSFTPQQISWISRG